MSPRRAATRLLLCAGLTLSAATLARPAPVDAAALTEFGYVARAFRLPMSSSQAAAYARDVDRDDTKDNQLGNVFVLLASQGFDFQAPMSDAIDSGGIVMLHSLRAPTLATTKNATYQVIYGKPAANPPLFDGTDSFTTGPTRSTRLATTIKDHRVVTAVGAVPLRIDLGNGPLTLGAVRTKIVATCTRSACTSGKINGAITREEIDARLVPKMAQLLTAMIAEDCPGPGPESCTPGSNGENVQSLFDDNADLVITTGELLENDLIQTLLRPDLDLFGDDDVEESLSFGFGFATVKATIVRP